MKRERSNVTKKKRQEDKDKKGDIKLREEGDGKKENGKKGKEGRKGRNKRRDE